jgi:hypothetical protein
MPFHSASDLRLPEASSRTSSSNTMIALLDYAYEGDPYAYIIPQADHLRVNDGNNESIGQGTYSCCHEVPLRSCMHCDWTSNRSSTTWALDEGMSYFRLPSSRMSSADASSPPSNATQ